MNYVAFSTRELGGKSSPFILSVAEWRAFSDYMKECISLPTSISVLQERICNINDGQLREGWNRLLTGDAVYPMMVNTGMEITTNVKQASRFWGTGGRTEIISLAQNIVTYADLICIKHHDDLNRVLLEAQNGNLSPSTKSKFIDICNDLSEHALRYHQQAQTMMTYLSEFYTEIEGCKDAHDNCTAMISRIGMRNHLEYAVVHNTVTFLLGAIRRIIPSETKILPVIRKIHLIWGAISYDLKELGDDIGQDLDNLPAIIAALELELAFENWSAIRQEAEDFYKNAENFS
ncbi:hypothetical protein [Bacillus toyonensis]|uniref:hypothetical protein n=1 Tax=Bacillus toyonensis TaxID=155322 RepID=UPI0009AB0109|nr:hypothetical protein [Bacillus toyonensis]PHE31166.1 hypothetical protein COF60_12755 [Bacillus toyonensis]